MMNRSKPEKKLCSLSLRTIFWVFAILAVTVLQQVDSQPIETEAPVVDAEAEVESESTRCNGICGDDEGELEDPSKTVSYQWNSRVPVCAGASCDTDTCANMNIKLSLFGFSGFECTRHRRDLQDVAGCTCSKPKTRPPLLEEVIPDPNARDGFDKRLLYWLFAIPVVLLIIASLCWMRSKCDGRKTEEKETEEKEESKEEEP